MELDNEENGEENKRISSKEKCEGEKVALLFLVLT